MGTDAALRQQKAAAGLEECQVVGRQLVAGIAHVSSADVSTSCASPNCSQEASAPVKTISSGPLASMVPVTSSRVAPAFSFQLVPQLEGAQQQRYVRRVLVVGETDDARDAVRRAHGVRDVEALQPQRAQAAPRQVIAGGGAHAADADDDRVVNSAANLSTSLPSSSFLSDQARPAAPMPDAAPGSLHHRLTRIAEDCAGVRLMTRGAGAAAQGVHKDPLQRGREIHFADASLNRAREQVVVDPGGAVHHQRGVDVAGQVRDAFDVEDRAGFGHAVHSADGHRQSVDAGLPGEPSRFLGIGEIGRLLLVAGVTDRALLGSAAAPGGARPRRRRACG